MAVEADDHIVCMKIWSRNAFVDEDLAQRSTIPHEQLLICSLYLAVPEHNTGSEAAEAGP
jgi:hypothetical protein